MTHQCFRFVLHFFEYNIERINVKTTESKSLHQLSDNNEV